MQASSYIMYGDELRLSDVMPRDHMDSMMHSHGEFSKMKELISSDSYSNYNHHNQNWNQNHTHDHHQRSNVDRRTEAPLMRYRSAPSSFYASILDESGCDDFLSPPIDASSNLEFFSQHQYQQQQQQQQQHQQQNYQLDSSELIQYELSSTTMKLESKESGTYGGSSQQMQHLGHGNVNGIYDHTNDRNNPESSSRFRSMNSTSSNLIRQSSSPAGFLASLNSESAGFGGTRDVAKTNSSSRMSNNISFSPGLSSSSMFSPQNPENRNQMNDSTFKNLKRARDGDSITLDRQNGYNTHTLVHHLSLPKTSSEKEIAENFLRFERDLVPTNSRAKRGCATHPRSIAERVRRTRISERMKKLQELFPNMDKQTSIADMLDMAVQHIKDLQKNLQTLKDARSTCACSSKQ